MQIREEPEYAVSVFESWTGLSVCVHDLHGALEGVLPPARGFHGRGPCIAVKQGPDADRCYAFEVDLLRPRLARWPAGRVHRCHAGLVEWMAPVGPAAAARAILFAGQRRAGPDLQLDVDVRAPDAPDRSELPSVDATLAARYLEGLRQLAARLDEWLRERRPGRPTASRAARIHEFVARRHAEDLRLADLARHLGLSRDRCAHAVREATGRTWKQLLVAARLRSATDLLRGSGLTVAAVALHSGFADLAHFHRVFKAVVGCTPGRYRRDPEIRREAPAPGAARIAGGVAGAPA